MEVGTIETPKLEEEPEEDKVRKGSRRRLTGSGGPPGSGGNGGDGSSGGDHHNDEPVDELQPFVPQKSRLVTAFLLVAVMMTFSGLIAAYVVIQMNGVIEWKPFDLPVAVWISTFLILVSSYSYHVAKTCIDANDTVNTRRWLVITTVLGAAFISSQIMAWLGLVQRGMYWQSNPYAGFFYILTALHAVHVLGGIIALGSVTLRSWIPSSADEQLLKRRTLANVTGWYWHFMAGLWVVIFVLLGFWK